jgi:hypothetical protein
MQLGIQTDDERVQPTLLLTTGQDRKPVGGGAIPGFLLGHSLKKSESIPRIGAAAAPSSLAVL